MISIGTPQKFGRTNTHEAARNLDLEMNAADEDFPSKQLLFLSFQIAQIEAKKETHPQELSLRGM